MTRFDSIRISRIARRILAHVPGRKRGNLAAYVYFYGDKSLVVLNCKNFESGIPISEAYLIVDGIIKQKYMISGPWEDSLVKQSRFFMEQLGKRTIGNSLVYKELDERRNTSLKYFPDEKKISEQYNILMRDKMIPENMTLEMFIGMKNANSDRFAESNFKDYGFIQHVHADAIKYYGEHNGSLNGLYEFENGLIKVQSEYIDIWNDKQTIINELNNAVFIFGNGGNGNGNDLIDRLFCSAQHAAFKKIGGFVSYLPQGMYPNQMMKWDQSILEASRILTSNGYGNLCYGSIIEATGQIDAAFEYDISKDLIRAVNYKESSIETNTECLIHELGHRFMHKFMDSRQKEELERTYNSKKTRFTKLKPGDVVEFSEIGEYTIVKFDKSGVRLVNDIGQVIENDRIGAIDHSVVKINGKDFVYEADGIPSSYALTDFSEFVAECFMAWNCGKFQGDVKKFFDGIFGK